MGSPHTVRVRKERLRISWKAALLTVFLLLITSTITRADDVTVNCSGEPSNSTYTSINSALEALSASGPHTITVSGTCNENVVIADHNFVTIRSAEDTTATISPQGGQGVLVLSSRGIVLEGLTITHGNPGVSMEQNSQVQVNGCKIKDNVGSGIVASENSTLGVTDSTVGGNGINGINVIHSAVSLTEGVIIEGSGGSGLRLEGSRARIEAYAQPNVFQNNGGAGVIVNIGSEASFRGCNTIQDNPASGIQVFAGSSAVVAGTVDANGNKCEVKVQNNQTAGIWASLSSSVAIWGSAKILNNGGAHDPDARDAGIQIADGSSLQLTPAPEAVEVEDNVGPGILLDRSGSAKLYQAVITGNLGGGLALEHLSAVWSFAENTIASVTCDSTSLLHGDLTGISAIDCKNVEAQKAKK
jgi:hypothetical protein